MKQRGNYDSVSPEVIQANLTDFDWAIIAILPDERSKLGYHPAFKTTKQITLELNVGVPRDAQLSTAQVGSRMRGLVAGRLTIPVSISLTGKNSGWQRTDLAVELLAGQKNSDNYHIGDTQ